MIKGLGEFYREHKTLIGLAEGLSGVAMLLAMTVVRDNPLLAAVFLNGGLAAGAYGLYQLTGI